LIGGHLGFVLAGKKQKSRRRMRRGRRRGRRKEKGERRRLGS